MCCCYGSISNPYVLLALLCCALLLTFLFPTGEPRRVVRMGDRTLERQERLAAAVIGAYRTVPPFNLSFWRNTTLGGIPAAILIIAQMGL